MTAQTTSWTSDFYERQFPFCGLRQLSTLKALPWVEGRPTLCLKAAVLRERHLATSWYSERHFCQCQSFPYDTKTGKIQLKQFSCRKHRWAFGDYPLIAQDPEHREGIRTLSSAAHDAKMFYLRRMTTSLM